MCACGQALSPDETFCTHCGKPVDSVAPPLYTVPGPSPYGYGGAPPRYSPPQYGPIPPPGSGYGPGGYSTDPYRAGLPVYPNQGLVRYHNYDKVSAGVLALLLGWAGIHKFYMGKWGWGLLYLFTFWTGIPALVGFIEGIMYLCQSDESFDYQYNLRQ